MKKSLLLLCSSIALISDLNAYSQQSPSHFQTEDKLDLVQPNYDFSLGGGVILPSTDKSYFTNNYDNLPIFHGDAALSRIFWINNIGISIGLSGRYLGLSAPSFNSSSTDPNQQSQYEFFAVTAEGITGVRYRNPKWTYLQPGLFAGVGATYFQEKVFITSSTLTNTLNQTVYTTQWSPTFEVGANLDISYTALTRNPNEVHGDIPSTVQDVLFRVSGSYLFDPVQTPPSLSGVNLQAGLVFLIQ